MKSTICLYTLSFCFALAACNQPQPKIKPPKYPSTIADSTIVHRIIEVSLINLIANHDKFNKCKVRLIGYLHLEFEGNELFFTKMIMITASVRMGYGWMFIPNTLK